MIYFFKRLISFWKTELVLLKSMNLVALISYIAFFLIISTLEIIFYKNQYIHEILFFGTKTKFTIYQIIVNNKIIVEGVGILLFLLKAKKQNFFKHLLLNRSFFNGCFELFTFSLSIVSLLFLLHIPFIPFTQLKQHQIYMVINVNILTLVVDLMLLVNWSFIRYIFAKTLTLSTIFTFYYLCVFLLHHLSFTSTMTFYGIVLSLNIIINLIILQRVITEQNNTKKNN